jgi:hypothetical protein
VFHALGGEEIRVWNGVTTVRLAATGPEISICSADVTCAAFQVEGAELAEKYLAEAETLLEPFAEGRRRLAEDCLNPYGAVGRDTAQTAAEDRCNPNPVITTADDCKRAAEKIGGRYTGSFAEVEPYYGCFQVSGAYTNGAKVLLFGTGGNLAQMTREDFSDVYTLWWLQRFVNVNLDADCLLLSNQAKLASMLKALLNVAQPACSDYGGGSSCPTEYGCELKRFNHHICAGTWRLN